MEPDRLAIDIVYYAILSSTEEDVYVVADMSHFKSTYKDRLFVKLLQLLHSENSQLSSGSAAKKFDDMDWDKRALLMASTRGEQAIAP